MFYGKFDERPDQEEFDFLVEKEYVSQSTVLNLYEGRVLAGTFRTLHGLAMWLEDDIRSDWRAHNPRLLEKYVGSDYEEYVKTTFKAYMRNSCVKFYGYRILLEYK